MTTYVGCKVCGTAAELIDHRFQGGGQQWTVTAPLYYKATPDNRSAEEGYCGPRCSTIGHTGCWIEEPE